MQNKLIPIALNTVIHCLGLCVLLFGSVVSCQSGREAGHSATEEVKSESISRLKYTSGIRTILEDREGRIWFGSHQEGACVFDGEKFQYFTTEDGLSDNQIRTIYEDTKGAIWFECGEGLSHYDGERISIVHRKNYLAWNHWQAGTNDLWFKSDPPAGFNQQEGHPGVYRFDGHTISYHAFPIEIDEEEDMYYSVSTPFVRGQNGRYWFGTYGAVFGYDGVQFTILDNERTGLNKKTGFLHIRAIWEDAKGNLWIGNNGIGVFKYDGQKIIDFTAKHHLRKEDTGGNSLDRIFSIGQDASGNIWFGTIGSGVWRYDGNALTNFTASDGLQSNHIWTIYSTKKGVLWFAGADPSGVYQFNGQSFDRIF